MWQYEISDVQIHNGQMHMYVKLDVFDTNMSGGININHIFIVLIIAVHMNCTLMHMCVKYKVSNTNTLRDIDINVRKREKKWITHEEYIGVVHSINMHIHCAQNCVKFKASNINNFGVIDINLGKRDQIWLPNMQYGTYDLYLWIDLAVMKVNMYTKIKMLHQGIHELY